MAVSGTGGGPEPRTSASLLQGPDHKVICGRFELLACLKSRPSAETWRARDRNDGSPAIVKLVPVEGLSSAARLRLEHEARVLQELDLTSKPIAVGVEGPAVYLAQSFVEGVTLQALLGGGPVPVEMALKIGIDVLGALSVAHERGIVHRDVKPANIIVDTSKTPVASALIDFGLSRSSTLDPAVRDAPVGTARYLAPEAAGLVDAEVDERADLYAAGVVLYECLTGRPPYQGVTVGEVLRAHANQEPDPVRNLRRGVPGALDALVQRLLAKDPAQRYQSAAAVISDLEALAEGLRCGVADPPLTIGLADRRRSLAEPGFIGRTAELAALRRIVEGEESSGGLVLLEAESGGGKSRMLEEMGLGLDPSIILFRGQGVDRVAMRPFQILDGVAARLAVLCADYDDMGAALRDGLGSWAEPVAAALPALASVLGVEASADGPEAYGEARTIGALCALLNALVRLDRTSLIVLDDAQWADGLTIKLLSEWSRSSRAPGPSPVVVVVAFRTEEVPEDHPLRSVGSVAHLRLAPLGEAEIMALCESMAGPIAAQVTSAVVRLAEGSPFMADAVMRGLVETGALEHSGEGWTIDSDALARAQTSRRAALFLTRRLQLLSPATRRLLSAGAVLGKEFDLDQALALADLEPDEAAGALQEARGRRVVWVDEMDSRCSFAHDKLREDLLEDLDADLRRSLHRRAAETMEHILAATAFELAYHFDAAGMHQRALPHAVAAARAARKRHALDVAVAQYRIAERGSADADPATRCDVYAGFGEVLSLAGDYEAAERYLQQALALAGDATSRAALEGRLGDVAFRRGDQVAARRYVEGALRHLGRWVPRTHLGFLVGALWEILVQAGHTAFAFRLGRRDPHGAEREFLAARLYSRLAYVFWFSSGRIPCTWTHLRGMNLAERYPPSAELAQAWSEHAPVMTMLPWYSRGIAYARKSYTVREQLGDQWGQGQSLSFYGVVLYAASRYRECITACQQAVDLLSRMGDRWEENTASWNIAFSYYRLGELTEAVETARRVHSRATAIGDQTARGIALSAWSRASNGNVPEAVVAAELVLGTDDAHTAVEVRVAEAVRLIGEGDWAASARVLDSASAVIRSSGLRQEYVAPVYAWQATVSRGLLASMPAVAGAARRRALRRARRVARRAVWQSLAYRNNLPHAYREAALVAAMAGRPGRARRLLARSARVAQEQGAAHEALLTERAMAEIAGPRIGPPGDGATDRSFPGGVPAPPVSEPGWSFSLADRFTSLLEVSRQISSAPSPGEVYSALRRAGVHLLRGERCHIIKLGAGADPDDLDATESGNPLDRLSRSLMRRALEEGGPVVAGEAMADDSTESMVLSNARSSLCAPIYSEGRPVAILYVMSRHLAGLFGEQEMQLASFVAALAGAALEHGAGSEARFRSLVQNSSDVITIVDEHGRISYQSASVTRVFGSTPEKLLGSALADWVHPDDIEALRSLLGTVGGGQGPSTLVKCRVSDSAGSWRHVETAVTDLRSDPGVRGIVLNTRDVSERVALEDELRHRAWHDIVTGLANRSLFSERVTEALTSSDRRSRPFAVLFVDLDDFKSINDTLGHATGDLVLQKVADRLNSCVGPDDTVARFGGDEFAILLESSPTDQATAVCEKVLAALADPIDVRGHQLEVQASIGVVMSGASESAEGLMAAADAALYVAKARGKRRYDVFESSMRAAAVARAGLRNELDHAVARSELRVLYQPVVSLATGEVTGFEALLRWARPHGVVLGPDQFIPLAEESGAIVGIGSWVLETACQQARRWRSITGRPISMAVNVAARQLLHPSLVDDVGSALEKSGLEPSALVLEITESATMQDTDSVVAKLDQLKALGVGLAIDDFGTGYSALSYLRRLPVDVLKVDRSFVSGLGRNRQDVAIVQAVISLASALELETVAEGVESLDQLEILAGLGCSHAQGYNWKRPCPPEEITQWLVLGAPHGGPARPRVLIVDDSSGIRATLRVAIGVDGRFDVVGEAADGAEAVERAGALKPDLILLDLLMPGRGGLEILPQLRLASPGSVVVILSCIDPSEVSAAAILSSRAVLDKTRDLSAVIERMGELALTG